MNVSAESPAELPPGEIAPGVYDVIIDMLDPAIVKYGSPSTRPFHATIHYAAHIGQTWAEIKNRTLATINADPSSQGLVFSDFRITKRPCTCTTSLPAPNRDTKHPRLAPILSALSAAHRLTALQIRALLDGPDGPSSDDPNSPAVRRALEELYLIHLEDSGQPVPSSK